MTAAVVRTSFSPLTRDAFDFQCGICHANGDIILEGEGSLLHSLAYKYIIEAIYTVGYGMYVTIRIAFGTYRPEQKAFTEHYEYPELPVPVAARYRGFHRWEKMTYNGCDQCSKACPVSCIYINKERVPGKKGFLVTGYTIDYSKCLLCALCVEPCPTQSILMGSSHDLSCYSRDGCVIDFARLPLEVASKSVVKDHMQS